MAFAMGLGLLAGYALAYILTQTARKKLARGSSAPSMVSAFAAAGAALALLPIGFLALVVGGNFGGGYAAALFGDRAAPLGVAIGLCVLLGVGVATCAFVAAFIGNLVALFVYGRATNNSSSGV
jgi:hypothetical protein